MSGKVKVSMEALQDSIMDMNNEGVCIECGEWSGPVEPDARKYTCPECGAAAVYGLEQAVLEMLVEVVE